MADYHVGEKPLQKVLTGDGAERFLSVAMNKLRGLYRNDATFLTSHLEVDGYTIMVEKMQAIDRITISGGLLYVELFFDLTFDYQDYLDTGTAHPTGDDHYSRLTHKASGVASKFGRKPQYKPVGLDDVIGNKGGLQSEGDAKPSIFVQSGPSTTLRVTTWAGWNGTTFGGSDGRNPAPPYLSLFTGVSTDPAAPPPTEVKFYNNTLFAGLNARYATYGDERASGVFLSSPQNFAGRCRMWPVALYAAILITPKPSFHGGSQPPPFDPLAPAWVDPAILANAMALYDYYVWRVDFQTGQTTQVATLNLALNRGNYNQNYVQDGVFVPYDFAGSDRIGPIVTLTNMGNGALLMLEPSAVIRPSAPNTAYSGHDFWEEVVAAHHVVRHISLDNGRTWATSEGTLPVSTEAGPVTIGASNHAQDFNEILVSSTYKNVDDQGTLYMVASVEIVPFVAPDGLGNPQEYPTRQQRDVIIFRSRDMAATWQAVRAASLDRADLPEDAYINCVEGSYYTEGTLPYGPANVAAAVLSFTDPLKPKDNVLPWRLNANIDAPTWWLTDTLPT